jgi:hypothetical protein
MQVGNTRPETPASERLPKRLQTNDHFGQFHPDSTRLIRTDLN